MHVHCVGLLLRSFGWNGHGVGHGHECFFSSIGIGKLIIRLGEISSLRAFQGSGRVGSGGHLRYTMVSSFILYSTFFILVFIL